MKSFLKYLLATIVGIIIVHVILFFVFIGLVGAIASFSSPTIEIKDNTILKLSLKTAIPDRASENPFQNFNLMTMSPEKQIGLNKILEYIDNASKDSRIKGIYLDLTEINSNFGALATIDEIRNALLRFKKSGKFIYSYTNLGYSQKSYYLATVADSVFVNPETPLLLTGMSANISFYKDLLKKIGVQPEVIRVGKFKSAVEPYIETHMSDANREQVQTYLGSLWGNIVKGISASRNIPVEKINQITDDFKIYPVEEFVKEGFFDGALYEYAMLDKLREACGLTENEKLSLTSFEDYTKVTFPTVNFAAEKIAVIYAQGNIEFQQGPESIGPELLKIYTSDPKVIQCGMEILLYTTVTYFMCGLMDLFPGALRGMGYSAIPMLLSIIGTVGTRIVWIFMIFPRHRSLDVLFISYPASWLITIILQVICYFFVRKRIHNPLP